MRSIAILADFDESQHPRDERGRFGEGSGVGGQTPTHILGPDGKSLTKTQAGDNFEALLNVHGDQLAKALGGGQTQQLTTERRQNPLDFRVGNHGIEVKTMVGLPGAKTGIRAADRAAKEEQAQQLGLKPGIVVQVVSQKPDGSGTVGVYYKDGIRSNTVVSSSGRVITEGKNAWKPLFNYKFTQAQYAKVASSIRAAADVQVPPELNQPGDLVIQIGPDGKPTDYEIADDKDAPVATITALTLPAITPEFLKTVKNPLGVLWGYPPIPKNANVPTSPPHDPHLGDPLHDPVAKIKSKGGGGGGTHRDNRHK